MRLRKLNLLVRTVKDDFGVVIKFDDGLNIIWADNTMGKSTCVNSIIFALGLEGMLSAKKNPPLKRVLQDKIEYSDGSSVAVVESEVRLAIENNNRDCIELRRTIKGEKNNKLITVISTDGRANDYYVSIEGAATRERGFHYFLAGFLGIDVPAVMHFDGRESPLYLQCIMPFMIINQLRGWSTITPPLPTQYGIRDLHRRVFEFVLNLDVYSRLQEKERVKQKEIALGNLWHGKVKELFQIAHSLNGRIVNIDLILNPSASWDVSPSPYIEMPSGNGSQWQTITKAIDAVFTRLQDLKQSEIPTANDKYDEYQKTYNETEEHLKSQEIILSRLVADMELTKSEAEQLHDRVSDIKRDLKRNKDASRIVKFGGKVVEDDLNLCPVCSSYMADSILDGADSFGVMSIEDNIAYLEEQLSIYSKLAAGTERNVQEKNNQINWVRSEIKTKRDSLKYLRESMIQDGRMPAKEAVREMIALEGKLAEFQKGRDAFFSLWCDFEDLAEQWRVMLKEKENLKGDLLSDKDIAKLNDFESFFIARVSQFDFNSSDLSSLEISRSTFKPSYSDGFDIQNDVSASDLVRIIWSYLLAFLDTKNKYGQRINHFGFLLMDEPGQQSVKKKSFNSLIKKTSEIAQSTNQIIIFSSAEKSVLHDALDNINCTYIEIEGRVLKPMPTT